MKRTPLAACVSALALALAPGSALAGGIGGVLDQAQQATNTNSTSQSADSSATTRQVNVNAPVSVLSKGSNNGDVEQSNKATTVAASSNENETDQANRQEQDGHVFGGEHGKGHGDHGSCGHEDRCRRDCGHKRHRKGCGHERKHRCGHED